MRTIVGLAALLLAGCAPTVTRRMVVHPAEALALGDRADVVAVNGRRASGSVWEDRGNYVVVDRTGQEVLSASDEITLDVEYGSGERIPHEGVVAAQPKAALLATGLVTLFVGSTVAFLGTLGATAAPPACPPSQWFCFELDFRSVYAGIAIAGGVTALTGVGLFIAGAATPVRIRRLAIAPLLTASARGGMVSVSF